jgi:Flp pilus assembly protein TadB
VRFRIHGVNRWLMNAPRWALALVNGLFFGLAMGLGTGLRDHDWSEGLVVAACGLVIYGPFVAVFQHRQFARYRAAAGDVPQADIRRAVREARRGRAPEDPHVRAAAYRVVTDQAEQLSRQRWWAFPFFGLLLAFLAVVAIHGTPLAWLAVLALAVVLVIQLLMPGRLRRRAEVLREA